MTDLSEFVTESEAASLLGVVPGKGNAWRALRGRVTIHQVGSIHAVRRDELTAYIAAKKRADIRGMLARQRLAVGVGR